MRPMFVLMLASALALSGCSQSAAPDEQTLDGKAPDSLAKAPDDYSLDVSAELLGPYSHIWAWKVEDAPLQHFEVYMQARGSTGVGYSLADVRLLFVDADGQERGSYEAPVMLGTAESLLHFSLAPGQSVPVGEWMLSFEATGVAHFDLVVYVAYMREAAPAIDHDDATASDAV
jgi:hypothetical protein